MLTQDGTGVDLVVAKVVVVGADAPVVETPAEAEVADTVETGVAAENKLKEGTG